MRFFGSSLEVLRSLKSVSLLLQRSRKRMSCPIKPPLCVRGMTEWQPELLNTSVLIPCLQIPQENIGAARKFIEKFTLKMYNLRPVQESSIVDKKITLLNPELVCKFSDLYEVEEPIKKLNVNKEDFLIKKFDLSVINWTPQDILKAILPEDDETVAGFSIIGHIIHLNLKEQLLPFKSVIGHVLLLNKNTRTVVNKSQTIDNTFRNFAMDILAGEDDFFVSVKENGCSFNFDFSKVYWNPRLSSEHERIVNMLDGNSLLLDACAGVGPFSVPAGRKCQVLANDLNPQSFKWLRENCEKDKRANRNIECFNLDAREFIKSVVKDEVVKVWTSESNISNIHITMNLPALAITFLDVFQGLFSDRQELRSLALCLPKVHVYGFSKAENCELDIKERCEEYLGSKLDDIHLEGVFFVRNVAPNKDMLRASFSVPIHVLFDLSVIPYENVSELESKEEKGLKRDRSPDSIENTNKK